MRLTTHQRAVFERIAAHAQRNGGALSTYIGSAGACKHLEEKGFITSQTVRGPKGGVAYRIYRLTERGQVAAK